MTVALTKATEQDTKELFNCEVQQAVNYANLMHAGEFRKHSRLPYITHCFEVLSLISRWNILDPKTIKVIRKKTDTRSKKDTKPVLDLSEAMPDIICWKAAICHDVRESRQDIDFNDVAKVIGREAALVVEELSFFYDPRNNLNEQDQKAQYIKSFFAKSLRALMIKCADRASNTMNLLQDVPKDAARYWRMGMPLFDAALTRGENVTAEFGPDVFPQIMFTRDMINRQIVQGSH